MIKTVVRRWNGPKFDWRIDVRVQLNDETWRRAKRGFNGTEKQAHKEGERFAFAIRDEAEKKLLKGEKLRKEVPTLAEFKSRFIKEHLEANRLKETTADTYKYRLDLYLVPKLGKKKLDEIDLADINSLKSDLEHLESATVNCILGVLSKLLNFAFDNGVLNRAPVRIKKLKAMAPRVEFYSFDEYAALTAAAKALDPKLYAMVLLGGDAGLRRGEMAALSWSDVDFDLGQLTVRGTLYKGVITSPKGGRARTVHLTTRLAEALQAIRHKKGPRVLLTVDDGPLTTTAINDSMPSILTAAGMKPSRKVHVLRHTFCSHLAMKGAPARSIMELAGHTDLATTLRYMHLSPEATQSAIRLLEPTSPIQNSPEKLGRIWEESVPA